jgi:hypothetical protein
MLRHVMLALSVLCASGCIVMGPSADVVSRAPCASGQFEAILVETNGGATTSFGYEVHLVPMGQDPSTDSEVGYLYGALRNAQAYGATLRWKSGTTLAVEFLEVQRIVRHKPTIRVGGTEFRIELTSGVEDLAAPAGGMLYNLERASRSK